MQPENLKVVQKPVKFNICRTQNWDFHPSEIYKTLKTQTKTIFDEVLQPTAFIAFDTIVSLRWGTGAVVAVGMILPTQHLQFLVYFSFSDNHLP